MNIKHDIPELRVGVTVTVDGVDYLGVNGKDCDKCDLNPINQCGHVRCWCDTRAQRVPTVSPNGGDI